MTSGSDLQQLLPPHIASRVRSSRITDGVVTLVVDAAGLPRAEADALQRELEVTLGALPDVREVRVAMMADKVQRRIIAVGSGKGGVGKSTLTANLAVALARQGRKVGVVDADIYGPSQPTLLNAEDRKPRAEGDKLVPVESEFGVSMLSMGQLVAPGKAIAWRGPMVGNALGQLMDAQWGDAELLLIDLPPGTGDVQLTLLQKFKPAGAVVVSTPQDLALIDATRAIDLFRQAQVPVIGIVENMAGYACPHCGEVSDPFGKGGAQTAAASLGETFLGRVPLAWEIRLASDTGQPPAANDGPHAEAFVDIAQQIGAWLDGAQG